MIKFIFISKDIDSNIAERPGDRYRNLGACVGMNPRNYQLDTDHAQLNSFLARRNATQLLADPEHGELYMLQ